MPRVGGLIEAFEEVLDLGPPIDYCPGYLQPGVRWGWIPAFAATAAKGEVAPGADIRLDRMTRTSRSVERQLYYYVV